VSEAFIGPELAKAANFVNDHAVPRGGLPIFWSLCPGNARSARQREKKIPSRKRFWRCGLGNQGHVRPIGEWPSHHGVEQGNKRM